MSKLDIACPKMPVRIKQFWNPWSDRVTDALTATWTTSVDEEGASILDDTTLNGSVVFPQCLVKNKTRDRELLNKVCADYDLPVANVVALWMVAAVTAAGDGLSVSYPQEPCVRLATGTNIAHLFDRFSPDVEPVLAELQFIYALPIAGSGSLSWNGRLGTVRNALPLTVGRPVGLGYFQIDVDACVCPGDVTWA
jgi:hypothetical protein